MAREYRLILPGEKRLAQELANTRKTGGQKAMTILTGTPSSVLPGEK